MLRTEDAIKEARATGVRACGMDQPDVAHWASYLKGTVELGDVCDAPDCGGKPARRIFLNVWGTLMEVDVCEEHAVLSDGRSRNGTWCDGP